MQRIELYLSGVKVPKLGSSQDFVLRQFLTKRATKEVNKNKLIAQMAMAVAGNSQEIAKSLSSIWNNYVHLEYYMEESIENREVEMSKEFELWKKVRPKIKRDKKGNLSVSELGNILK